MSSKMLGLVAGIIFLVIAVGHLLRLILKFQIVLGSHPLPLWLSWVGLLVAGFLAYAGLRLSRTPPQKQ